MQLTSRFYNGKAQTPSPIRLVMLLGTIYGGLGNDVIYFWSVGKVMGGLGKDTITTDAATTGISVLGGGSDDQSF